MTRIAALTIALLAAASPAFALGQWVPRNGPAENGTTSGAPATIQGITLPNAITLRG